MAKHGASMKVPALRRGNFVSHQELEEFLDGLNESPRPKAGKFCVPAAASVSVAGASMKVPALRRGNVIPWGLRLIESMPQ